MTRTLYMVSTEGQRARVFCEKDDAAAWFWYLVGDIVKKADEPCEVSVIDAGTVLVGGKKVEITKAYGDESVQMAISRFKAGE